VAYLNDTARKVPALATPADSVTIDARSNGDSGVVTGRLNAARGKYFRMTGAAVGQPMLDIGSNDKEFWYWISKAQPAYVYHCSHADLAKGNLRVRMPFQPDMIMSALGIAEYDPQKKYEMTKKGNRIELSEQVTTPDGQQAQKVVVFNRNPRKGEPTVVAYLLRDLSGKEIASATIQQVTIDKATSVELPRRVFFSWPSQKVEMKMKLDDLRVVQFDPGQAQNLYSRTRLTLPGYDLAVGPDQMQGRVQRVGDPPQ
jgi:hypothetical protein